jgi:hypothetical protein
MGICNLLIFTNMNGIYISLYTNKFLFDPKCLTLFPANVWLMCSPKMIRRITGNDADHLIYFFFLFFGLVIAADASLFSDPVSFNGSFLDFFFATMLKIFITNIIQINAKNSYCPTKSSYY